MFTQYNQTSDGKRIQLPNPHIDTGMGLERTAAAVQGKPSPYETDLFLPLIEGVARLVGKSYGKEEDVDRAMRIIVEHGRGVAFLIADGVLPSNEGRGYVLRRILRRASLFGRRLGLDKPFLAEVAGMAIDSMEHIYPELGANRSLVEQVITTEEGRFINTLETGLSLVEGLIEQAASQGGKTLPGEQVFRLYDTYGFPEELIAEIAAERGLSVDLDGFKVEMERQRERARAAQKVVSDRGFGKDEVIVEKFASEEEYKASIMEFIGYETTVSQSRLLELRVEGQLRKSAGQGSEVDIMLDKTPFYGEMGGQVGDTGKISSRKGEVIIANTVRTPSDAIVHRGKVTKGIISTGAKVEAKIDIDRRLDIARNHTATHLLQSALRAVLGGHVYQRGSLVEPGRFRFDFAHLVVIPEQQLAAIQSSVNERIRQNLPVKARTVPHEQAIAEEAIAVFEEKYGDTVRMLEIGEPAISKELCGGTHVSSTGEIGFFIITSEAGIGTGLHRIEAVTGRAAESLMNKNSATLKGIAKELKSVPEEVYHSVNALIGELELEHKHSLWVERELSWRIVESLVNQVKQVGGVTVLVANVPPLAKPVIREMGDILRDKLKSAVIILATTYDDTLHFLAMVTPDLVAKGLRADKIVKQVARVTGGSGGGKAEMAQAGGKDITKLDEALNSVLGIVKSKMSSSPGGGK